LLVVGLVTARDRMHVIELARAFDELLASAALSVAFQPIVDLANGQVSGYEVLGRCTVEQGPLAPIAGQPAALLDAAHTCGRLLALDRRWRTLAIDAIAARDDGHTAFFLNVDPRVADDPLLVPGFTRALIERHGLRADRFVLELTEATARAPGRIEQVLRHYQSQGFRVAIDDLGAGEHSLLALLRMRPHVIKLDRGLIRGLDADDGKRHLVRALAGFAARTEAVLVAEGVETSAELLAARAAGASCAQGFFLGRPSPVPMPISKDGQAVLSIPASISSARAEIPSSTSVVDSLLQIIDGIGDCIDLDRALEQVARRTAELLGIERVSLRLLDDTRTRLLVAARSGSPIHEDARTEFRVGEGLIGWVVAQRRVLRLANAEVDARFVPKPGMRGAIGSFLGAPILDEEGCIGVLAASAPTPGAFSAGDERLMRLITGIVAPHLQVGRLRRLAQTDPLTRFFNRHALDEILPLAGNTATLSVALLDVDQFKSINDRSGHAVGDEVLRAVAAAIVSVLRRDDRVVRVGGDEFLLVLPGAASPAARQIAERARTRIAETEIDGHLVTTSAGVAERAPHEPRERLLARADAALYRAKAAGRNCVMLDEEIP
jgi:diguanylate cyclase (GGDEF)-like protein